MYEYNTYFCKGTAESAEIAGEALRNITTRVFRNKVKFTDRLHIRWLSNECLRKPSFDRLENENRCTIHIKNKVFLFSAYKLFLYFIN